MFLVDFTKGRTDQLYKTSDTLNLFIGLKTIRWTDMIFPVISIIITTPENTQHFFNILHDCMLDIFVRIQCYYQSWTFISFSHQIHILSIFFYNVYYIVGWNVFCSWRKIKKIHDLRFGNGESIIIFHEHLVLVEFILLLCSIFFRSLIVLFLLDIVLSVLLDLRLLITTLVSSNILTSTCSLTMSTCKISQWLFL